MDVTLPSTFQAIVLNFLPAFTAPSFQNFVMLTSGWIRCVRRHTISEVILCGCGPARKKHFAAFYRFFSRATWNTDALGRILFSLLLERLGERIVVIVDDTLCRRSGPHFWGASMHHDPLASTYGRGTAAGRLLRLAFGHNWVVLAVHVPVPWNPARGVAVPILWRLYRGKKGCPKTAYNKKTELARELVDLVAAWLPRDKELSIVGDGEYASQTIVRALPGRAHFTGPMLMDAAVYDRPRTQPALGRPRKKGDRLPSPRALAVDDSVRWKTITPSIYGRDVSVKIKTQDVLWYTVAQTRLVRMIVTRDPNGRIEERAYFTTDLSLSAEQVLANFAKRWSLEVAFRDAKQHLGLEDPQNGWWRRPQGARRRKKKPGPQPKGRRGAAAVGHTTPMVLCVYGLVIVWYLRHGKPAADVARVRKQRPWYRHKKEPSFADMLNAIRREFCNAHILRHPSLRRVRRNIAKLFPALDNAA